MAVASLVLGILAIVFAIVGIGYQWIGAIVGIIGTVLCLITFVACVACLGALGAGASSLDASTLEGFENWLNSQL